MPLFGDAKREYDRKWKNDRRLDWIASKGGRCVKCGSDERIEIDHKDPSMKEAHVSHLWTYTREIREAELAKCQLLCHECHYTKTYGETPRITHGTTGAYRWHKCRCQPCRDAKAATVRRQRAAAKARMAA